MDLIKKDFEIYWQLDEAWVKGNNNSIKLMVMLLEQKQLKVIFMVKFKLMMILNTRNYQNVKYMIYPIIPLNLFLFILIVFYKVSMSY